MKIIKLRHPHISFQSLVLRRCIRMGLTLTIASILAGFFHYSHSYWLPLTATIIMQPTIGGTLRKGMQRSIGTIAGIILGGLLLWLSKNNIYIQAPLLIVIVFVTYFLQAFNQINYGIFVIPLTMMVVFLLTSLTHQPLEQVLLERSIDTVAASVLVILTSYLLLPNSTRNEAAVAIRQVSNTISELLLAIAEQKITSAQYHQRVLEILQNNQRIWPEWMYETYFHPVNRAVYQQVVLCSETCFEILAALKWRMEQIDLEEKIVLVNLLQQYAILFHHPLESGLNKLLAELPAIPVAEEMYFLRLRQAATELQSLMFQIKEMEV